MGDRRGGGWSRCGFCRNGAGSEGPEAVARGSVPLLRPAHLHALHGALRHLSRFQGVGEDVSGQEEGGEDVKPYPTADTDILQELGVKHTHKISYWWDDPVRWGIRVECPCGCRGLISQYSLFLGQPKVEWEEKE